MRSSVSIVSKILVRRITLIGPVQCIVEPMETTCGGAVEREITMQEVA